MSLHPNGVNPVCLLRKITTWLRDTNFRTSSACFALSFVRQPNGQQCIQIVQNTPKHDFRVQWGGSVRSLRKIPTRLRGTNFFTTSAHFELVRHPNGTKCTQIVWNAPKHKFRSQQGQSGVFVAKNYNMTSWHKLLHKFGPFLHWVL